MTPVLNGLIRLFRDNGTLSVMGKELDHVSLWTSLMLLLVFFGDSINHAESRY